MSILVLLFRKALHIPVFYSMKLLNCSGIGMSNKAKVCRICMLGNIKGVISLFTLCDGTVKIYDKVMEVANIQVINPFKCSIATHILFVCLIVFQQRKEVIAMLFL